MSKQRRPWADWLVFAAVRGVVAVLQTVPFRWGLAVADAFASLAYRANKRHRRVADENLRHAFGDSLTPDQRDAMVRAVYRHFLRVIVEIAWLPRLLRVGTWRRYVTMVGGENVVRAILSGRPVIVLTGHFGNWEMAGTLLASIGVRSFAIARTLDNPFLDRYLRRFRTYTGQTILSKTGDYDKIRRVLEERQVLVSVADQSAGPNGLFVDFFGRPASTHKAVALLALEYDALIVVGYGYRDRPSPRGLAGQGGPRFHYRVESPVALDSRDYQGFDAVRRLTQDFTRQLEDGVRKAPEQYLWLHGRWKHQPKVRQRRAAA